MSTELQATAHLCVGIGEALWDLLPAGKVLGGAPVNVVANIVQLGVRGATVSAVGDDADGIELGRRLRAMGVNDDYVQVKHDIPTGVVDVALDAAGVPLFTIRTPSAWDAVDVDGIPDSLAGAADAVVFGTLAQRDARSRAAICSFLKKVRPGCLRVLDVNMRFPFVSESVLSGSLALADVLKLNDTELPVLAAMLGIEGDETVRLRALRERFALDLVVYTRGGKGSRMITAEQDESHSGYPVRVVDTVGAGDAFTAVVTAGLLRVMKLSMIQELANRVAAFVCSQAGAVARLPDEIVMKFKSGGEGDGA